ncbi:hypothetical protein LIER_25808 [Lithospermum erythrorhizon]|uniref:Uncharacterized protein n=1 Tax=Lithospermum erythrorhizon TaxID=34254 RepID=A0AAV3RA54_LITER
MRFSFEGTNNEAEYETLTNGFNTSKCIGDKTHPYKDRFSTVGWPWYETLSEATVLEWVEEGAFRTKEVLNNVPKSERGSPEPWYEAVFDILRTRTMLGDPSIANKIPRWSLRYTLLDGVPRLWNAFHLRKYYV